MTFLVFFMIKQVIRKKHSKNLRKSQEFTQVCRKIAAKFFQELCNESLLCEAIRLICLKRNNIELPTMRIFVGYPIANLSFVIPHRRFFPCIVAMHMPLLVYCYCEAPITSYPWAYLSHREKLRKRGREVK